MYVAARLDHPQANSLIAAGTTRDDPKGSGDERFGIQISSGRDHPFGLPTYYEVLVNPKGVIYDALINEPIYWAGYHHRGRSESWDAQGLECKTVIRADGWSVEMAIPFSAIPEWKEKPPKMTRIQLVRHKRGKEPEKSIWWPTLAESYEHLIERFPLIWFD